MSYFLKVNNLFMQIFEVTDEGIFWGKFFCGYKNKIPPLAGFVVRSWYWLRRHYQKRSGCYPFKYL
jgi:hypothetical protein